MHLRNIKLVTLDATNTILKFRVPPWVHYTIVARDYGFTGSEENVKSRLFDSYKVMWNQYPNFGKDRISWEDWWTEVVRRTFIGQLPPNTDMDTVAQRLINEFKTNKCWCVADHAKKLLNLLQAKNIRLGVVSNFDPRLNEILECVELNKYFDFIITSYEVGYSKPDKRIFDLALSKYQGNIDPANSLHIGDDLKKDFEGAKCAGWHAVLLAENMNTDNPPAPQHVFTSITELVAAISTKKLIL